MPDSNPECSDFRAFRYMEGKGKLAVSIALGFVISGDHMFILGENGGVYGGVVKTCNPKVSMSFDLPDGSILVAFKKNDTWFASDGRRQEFKIFVVYVNHPAFMGLVATS